MRDVMPGSPGEHRLQTILGTSDRADRFYREQVSDRLTPRMCEFISRMEMVWIATADSSGHCDCSFRSGPPGFVHVLADGQLAFPDYRGNGVMASSGNLLENAHIGMWFGDFEQELIGLHVNGRAVVLSAGQPGAAAAGLPEPGHPGQRPTHWVAVSVEECYVHCRKHLPRLVRQPVLRRWGTDSPLHKGGDYFGVASCRAGADVDIGADTGAAASEAAI